MVYRCFKEEYEMCLNTIQLGKVISCALRQRCMMCFITLESHDRPLMCIATIPNGDLECFNNGNEDNKDDGKSRELF